MPNRHSPGALHLDAGDAAELVEMLTFLGDWLDGSHADFAGSLCRFTTGLFEPGKDP